MQSFCQSMLCMVFSVYMRDYCWEQAELQAMVDSGNKAEIECMHLIRGGLLHYLHTKLAVRSVQNTVSTLALIMGGKAVP